MSGQERQDGRCTQKGLERRETGSEGASLVHALAGGVRRRRRRTGKGRVLRTDPQCCCGPHPLSPQRDCRRQTYLGNANHRSDTSELSCHVSAPTLPLQNSASHQTTWSLGLRRA